MTWKFHTELILDTYRVRSEKNSSYSIRALARDLKISHSTLSGIMTGKRFPSFETSRKICQLLKLPESLEFLFLRSLALEKKKLGNQRLEKEFLSYLNSGFHSSKGYIASLSEEEFQLISDWYYYAILELTFLDDFESDASWISARLGISQEKTWEALEVLFRLKLLKKIGKKWVKTSLHHTTSDKSKTSAALKKRQAQLLKISMDALKNTPLENRAHHGMTMAINKHKIPEAKEEIRKFLFKMCQLLEVDERQDVYELQVSLFPLKH